MQRTAAVGAVRTGFTLLLVVMRGLLRNATELEQDLAEVARLDAICRVLDCQPGDLLVHVPDDQ